MSRQIVIAACLSLGFAGAALAQTSNGMAAPMAPNTANTMAHSNAMGGDAMSNGMSHNTMAPMAKSSDTMGTHDTMAPAGAMGTGQSMAPAKPAQ